MVTILPLTYECFLYSEIKANLKIKKVNWQDKQKSQELRGVINGSKSLPMCFNFLKQKHFEKVKKNCNDNTCHKYDYKYIYFSVQQFRYKVEVAAISNKIFITY